MTAEQCDPRDDSFGKSFVCRKQYEERAEQRRAEVLAAAQRADQTESSLADIESERARVGKELTDAEARQTALEARIRALESEGAASRQRIEELLGRSDAVNQELDELQTLQKKLEDSTAADSTGVEDRIVELLEEQRELEALLLELES